MSIIKKTVCEENVWVAPGARLMGHVTVGRDSSIWYNAVVRGDEASISIGKGSNIQDNCVIHADHGDVCSVGDGTTIGHSAIIHGCRVGDNTVIGMGSIVLNGAEIGNNCIIGAGSLVTQNTRIPDGMLAFGRPAKPVRPLSPEEIEKNRENANHYVLLKNEHEILANSTGDDL